MRQLAGVAAPRARALLLAAAVATLPACLPYTVGSTARTVPPDEWRQTAMVYVIPDGLGIDAEPKGDAMPGMDAEVRTGLSERTDLGVRVPSYSGVVVTVKHRLRGGADAGAAALAVQAGGGLVNLGSHAHVELSLLASGRTRGRVTPYGGLRVMQVAPLSRDAVHDSPTAGGFVGVRIGSDELGVSPELGVFHDRSALGLRERPVILVPAISLHGEALMRVLRLIPRRP